MVEAADVTTVAVAAAVVDEAAVVMVEPVVCKQRFLP